MSRSPCSRSPIASRRVGEARLIAVLGLGAVAVGVVLLGVRPGPEHPIPASEWEPADSESPYRQRFAPITGKSFLTSATEEERPFKAGWISAMFRNEEGSEGWYWLELIPGEGETYRVNTRLQRNAPDLFSDPIPVGSESIAPVEVAYDGKLDRSTYTSTGADSLRLSFTADSIDLLDAASPALPLSDTVAQQELKLKLTPLDRVLQWKFRDSESGQLYFFHSLLCSLSGELVGAPVNGIASVDMFWGTVGDGLWGEESVIFQELEEAWFIYYHQTAQGVPAYGTLFLGSGGWAGGYSSVGLGNAELLSNPTILETLHDPASGVPTHISIDPVGTFTPVTVMDNLTEWGSWYRSVHQDAVEPQFAWWEHVHETRDDDK